ncbi:hypothetical protein BCR36DRAFT_408347 [Piromyces finnis]|uniref:LITAF domain-containing protein n=1 Tax=Piromyces finnis TaxID=1754191 RepID=A0A1Y1VM42_9FUNG|nr:hypothetical protein BCR36DRAFT_408347 [Piromyces finnis]|eukprot:ORX59978.1 hypothetical protein BCR36DRAFT_408347 [Piromyces finnis]
MRTPSVSKAKGELVSEVSTVEIKKTTKVSTAPLLKKKSSVLKPHKPISEQKQKPVQESEEPLLQDNIQNQYSTQQSNLPKKMDQNKQPQIHPTPTQPQMSQISPMAQPNPGYPFQNQVLLQNPSQAQLFNTQGQYSITVNTNDPNAFTTMMMPSVVSRNPVQMRCPYCNENIVTVIKYENNSLVWILTILLFIFCCCCFCIPLLIDDIKDVIHYCPVLNIKLIHFLFISKVISIINNKNSNNEVL